MQVRQQVGLKLGEPELRKLHQAPQVRFGQIPVSKEHFSQTKLTLTPFYLKAHSANSQSKDSAFSMLERL